MLTPGFLGDGKCLHGPVLAGLPIAGFVGMGDTSSLRGVGASLDYPCVYCDWLERAKLRERIIPPSQNLHMLTPTRIAYLPGVTPPFEVKQ